VAIDQLCGELTRAGSDASPDSSTSSTRAACHQAVRRGAGADEQTRQRGGGEGVGGRRLGSSQPQTPCKLSDDGSKDGNRGHPEEVPPVHAGGGQTGSLQRWDGEPRPFPQLGEDQRTDPALHQTGQQHEEDLTAGKTHDLEHEHSGDQGVTEHGRDRRS
jgi:hypothetical protein